MRMHVHAARGSDATQVPPGALIRVEDRQVHMHAARGSDATQVPPGALMSQRSNQTNRLANHLDCQSP